MKKSKKKKKLKQTNKTRQTNKTQKQNNNNNNTTVERNTRQLYVNGTVGRDTSKLCHLEPFVVVGQYRQTLLP